MFTKQTFDGALLEAASAGSRLPSLPDLMRRTMKLSGADQLAVTTLVSELDSPGDALAEAIGGNLVNATVVDKIAVFEVGQPSDSYVVSLWPSSQPSVWHAVSTVPVTDKRWQKVQRWMRRAAPAIAPVYLDEHVLPDLCSKLSDHGPVLASRMTARITFDGSSYNRGWKEDSPVSRPSYREALEEIQGRGTVRTLTVTVGDQLTVHLRRSAGSTYYGGDPHLFHSVVLSILAQAVAGKAAVFRDRQRRKHEPVAPPITIQLHPGHFEETERLQELVRGLDKTPAMGVAVLHGNPYLHVAVTDYRDGSNYDIVVTNDDAISIYPGFRTSLGSLARMTDAIGELVAPVAIRNEQAHPRLTTDDFFSSV